MSFSKRFPRTVKGSAYPEWVEISLTPEEERIEEEKAQKENIALLQQCMDDARLLMQVRELKDDPNGIIALAAALFDKRASHAVYWKERLCKEKFDEMNC